MSALATVPVAPGAAATEEPSTVWLPSPSAETTIGAGAAVISFRATRASTLSVVVVDPDSEDRYADRVARAHATLHGRDSAASSRAMLSRELRPVATWQPATRSVRPHDAGAREALRAWLHLDNDPTADWDLRLQLRASRAHNTGCGQLLTAAFGRQNRNVR